MGVTVAGGGGVGPLIFWGAGGFAHPPARCPGLEGSAPGAPPQTPGGSPTRPPAQGVGWSGLWGLRPQTPCGGSAPCTPGEFGCSGLDELSPGAAPRTPAGTSSPAPLSGALPPDPRSRLKGARPQTPDRLKMPTPPGSIPLGARGCDIVRLRRVGASNHARSAADGRGEPPARRVCPHCVPPGARGTARPAGRMRGRGRGEPRDRSLSARSSHAPHPRHGPPRSARSSPSGV